MRKLLKKKVNVFGKGIPVFVFVILGLAVVTAALLPYFGKITGLVTVNQGLLVDGLSMPESGNIQYSTTLTSLEEKTVSSGLHYLKNTAAVVGVVKLNSVCSAIGDGCGDTLTTKVFKLSIPAQSAPNLVQDRVTAKGAITLEAITTLSFDYMLTTTTSGNSPYFVLELDTNSDSVADKWAISWQDMSKPANTWHTYGTNLLFHIPGSAVCTQQNPCNLATVKTDIGAANLLQVKVMIGYWGDLTPTTALVKDIKVNTVDVVGNNGLIVREYHVADPNDYEWGDVIVDFSIETYFPKMMKPATYTITTTVVPA